MRRHRARPGGSTLINARGGSREWTKTIAKYIRTPGNQYCWLRFPGICKIRSETIDHYHPRKFRPDLADNPSNWRPACVPCNRARRHTPPHLIEKLRQEMAAKVARRKPKALGFFG